MNSDISIGKSIDIVTVYGQVDTSISGCCKVLCLQISTADTERFAAAGARPHSRRDAYEFNRS